MASFYSRFYWRIGFGSRLYDLLTPESYVESMRRLVECLPAGKNTIFLDAGCGSGGLINILKHRIQNGVYVGTDMLLEGLLSAQKKTDAGNISNNVYFAQADFTYSIPLKNNSVDIIIAHFQYIPSHKKREGISIESFVDYLGREGPLQWWSRCPNILPDVSLKIAFAGYQQKMKILPPGLKNYLCIH